MNRKNRKANYMLSVLLILMLGLTGCRGCGDESTSSSHSASTEEISKTESIEESAQKTAEAFSNADMAAINQIVFGTSQSQLNEEDEALQTETTESAVIQEQQESVLARVFEYVTVEVSQITDSAVEYKIKAPDMSNLFTDMSTDCADTTDITADEMLEYITNYAKKADIKESVVSLEYVYVDNKPVVSYQNEEFINAVTGGLLEAYKVLYSEMIEELKNEILGEESTEELLEATEALLEESTEGVQ